MLTRQNAERSGRAIEELEKVEDPSWMNAVGRCFLRMRVAMVDEKPLVARFWILREGNKKLFNYVFSIFEL